MEERKIGIDKGK